jgi:4-alpha-glucanotransferase
MHDLVQPTGQRTSGLLFHPTSLPGRYGSGDPGASAYQCVDFLVASGQQDWQVLPLGPPDEVYSPYQGVSSMAGNPLLLSLDTLVRDGWLAPEALREAPVFPDASVDYEAVILWKGALLRQTAAQCVQVLSGTDRLTFAACGPDRVAPAGGRGSAPGSGWPWSSDDKEFLGQSVYNRAPSVTTWP